MKRPFLKFKLPKVTVTVQREAEESQRPGRLTIEERENLVLTSTAWSLRGNIRPVSK